VSIPELTSIIADFVANNVHLDSSAPIANAFSTAPPVKRPVLALVLIPKAIAIIAVTVVLNAPAVRSAPAVTVSAPAD
jgi:hypothetical protein